MLIETNLPDNTARDKQVRDIFPKHLADYLLTTYPNATRIDGSYHMSKLDHYRNAGNNQLIVDRKSVLSFTSENFGICCGAQLLVNFYVDTKNFEEIKNLFKVWTSDIVIPHFYILVKTLEDGQWIWKNPVYEDLACVGTLIKEWRNPLYSYHLLCMYEVTCAGSFLNDLEAIPKSYSKGAIVD